MHPSCRWFLAAGCWLMACLVAPGAFRVAAAISVSRSAAGGAAGATASYGFAPADNTSGRSLGGGMFLKSTMQRAATNVAAAAAAAAALAALATGTLSLGMDGSPGALRSPTATVGLSQKSHCLLAALGASLGPHGGSHNHACPPLGLPSILCPAAANKQWIRDCISGRNSEQESLQRRPEQKGAASSKSLSAGHAASLVPALLPFAPSFEALSRVGTSGLELIKQGASSLYKECGELASCTFRAYQAWWKVGDWVPLSATWRWRLNTKGLIMRRIDAGGGGDCLFHAVALSLSARGKPVDSLELRRIAADKATGVKACEMGAVMTPEAEEVFVESLGVMAALESAGEWKDGWSPSAILEGKNDYVATTGYVFDTSTTIGKARAVHHEMRLPGNNHWGTASDICALEEALDLGIIVMDDSTGKIYPTACERKQRSHYTFLYFVGGCHFQLVGLETPQGHKTLFKPDELPVGLFSLFKEDTKNDLIPWK